MALSIAASYIFHLALFRISKFEFTVLIREVEGIWFICNEGYGQQQLIINIYYCVYERERDATIGYNLIAIHKCRRHANAICMTNILFSSGITTLPLTPTDSNIIQVETRNSSSRPETKYEKKARDSSVLCRTKLYLCCPTL